MKAKTHGKYLIQLNHLGIINCYLVQEEDGLTLIDTMISGLGRQIIEASRQFGKEIVRIVVTHAHSDHTGSLDELHEALPKAEVLLLAREAPFLGGNKSLERDEPQAPIRGEYPIRKTKPTRLLKDGEHVGSLRVVATPGHTPGHASFLDERDQTLIAGDTFQTLGGIAVAGTIRLLFPLPALGTWHKLSALESARRLRFLEPSRLATGHGPVRENPLREMDGAIVTLAQELEKQALYTSSGKH
ncbi:MBL fold metallo-hydrolase [Ktedonospora formicarum]|uniref:MBL fold metallo-hydrolase n=1 Tax=Ktedonospora formicarum TaxID=2778364 RepID=A0A8J3I283_9CHLR|nr:MBL fold metallo-hydrolase [Ktedonospora formicarum]GHO43569.1 MBL fold metallo-hydrolase [Ktedonospora formicarum]